MANLIETHKTLKTKQFQLPLGEMPQDFRYIEALAYMINDKIKD